MANKTIGCVSMCIDFAEAVTYANTVVDEELDDTNYVEKVEIQRMPGAITVCCSPATESEKFPTTSTSNPKNNVVTNV